MLKYKLVDPAFTSKFSSMTLYLNDNLNLITSAYTVVLLHTSSIHYTTELACKKTQKNSCIKIIFPM